MPKWGVLLVTSKQTRPGKRWTLYYMPFVDKMPCSVYVNYAWDICHLTLGNQLLINRQYRNLNFISDKANYLNLGNQSLTLVKRGHCHYVLIVNWKYESPKIPSMKNQDLWYCIMKRFFKCTSNTYISIKLLVKGFILRIQLQTGHV